MTLYVCVCVCVCLISAAAPTGVLNHRLREAGFVPWSHFVIDCVSRVLQEDEQAYAAATKQAAVLASQVSVSSETMPLSSTPLYHSY
jgi:hypothetical protein